MHGSGQAGQEVDAGVRRTLRIRTELADGAAIVAPSGALALAGSPALRRHLLGLLREPGRVVVDLRRLLVTEPDALLLFPAVLAQAGGWPRARLALCGVDRDRLGLLADRQVTETVPVRDRPADAIAALDLRPAAVRRTIWLITGPDLASDARLFLADCRADWAPVPPLADAAHARMDAMLAVAAPEEDMVLALTAEVTGERLDLLARAWTSAEPAHTTAVTDGGAPSVTRHRDGFTVRVSLTGDEPGGAG